MGAIVLAIAGGFLFFAYSSSNIASVDGYLVTAKFENVDGLSVGNDVRVGGIKVGSVVGQDLDPKTYNAVVKMNIKSGIAIPDDSSAAIVGDGLLGGKFVSITVGGSDNSLAANGEIQFTQSAVNLESLLGKFVFSDGGVDKESKVSQPEPVQPAQ